MGIDDVMRLIAVLEINTHRVLTQRLDVADVTLTAQNMVVRA